MTEEETRKDDNGCLAGCAGCGCLIVILFLVFSVVSWAWHIHWLFGLLLILFLLGLK